MVKMEKLVAVVSITDMEIYKKHLEKTLLKIGLKYTLIKTNPNISITESYNSIVEYKNLKESKYILFVHQDVEFLDENWGQKIMELCDKAVDFGYGGTECYTHNGVAFGCGYAWERNRRWGNEISQPIIVETCDGGIGVIPTRLFLERQFDEQFKWYPVMEDYACWVQFIKKLKVYCLPIVTYHVGGSRHGWNMKFKNRDDYVKSLKRDYHRLCQKWNRKIYTTSCHGE